LKPKQLLLLAALSGLAGAAWADDEGVRRNPFNDPFVQISQGMADCPVPEMPLYTEDEIRKLAHERAQRGVSCWLAGRCRLHNAYLYDAEIIPRVSIAITSAGRFRDTSVWALGQRRRVWLKGCVQSAAQAAEIEGIVRLIDDVEGVENELMVGTRGTPPYAARAASSVPSSPAR
jgi:hypothetical protein